MTYIAAIRLPGLNAIIADSRISWQNNLLWEGTNTSVKTGILFPGCIFGRLNNVGKSAEFILKARNLLSSNKEDTDKNWEILLKFINHSEPSPKPYDFQLVLSVSLNNNPTFFIYDSVTNSVNPFLDNNSEYLFRSFGSGRGTILDENLQKAMEIYPKTFQQIVTVAERLGFPYTEHPLEIVPYQISFQLSELSLSFESGHLEEKLVGGPFSFTAQTYEQDFFQRKSIYLLSTLDAQRKAIDTWIYRLIRTKNALFLERHIPPRLQTSHPHQNPDLDTRVVLLDGSSYSHDEWQDFGIAELKRAELDIWNSEPYFYFCGLGNTDPSRRVSKAFFIKQDGSIKDIFAGRHRLTKRLRNDIKATYKKVEDQRESSEDKEPLDIELVQAALCREVEVDIEKGKLRWVEIFDKANYTKFPAIHNGKLVLGCLWKGKPSNSYLQTIQVLGPGKKPLYMSGVIDIIFEKENFLARQNFNNLAIPSPGRYYFVIQINGSTMLELTFDAQLTE